MGFRLEAIEESSVATQIVGKNGRVLPGLYAFEVLHRSIKLENEIRKFDLKEDLKEKLAKIGTPKKS
jgi:hypothetical protein